MNPETHKFLRNIIYLKVKTAVYCTCKQYMIAIKTKYKSKCVYVYTPQHYRTINKNNDNNFIRMTFNNENFIFQ